MHLLKPINNTISLIPYEQLYIQFLHEGKKLIPEQSSGDPNPSGSTGFDPYHPQLDKTSRTAPSKPYIRHTQRLSGTPHIHKLGYIKFVYNFKQQ